MKRYGSMMVAFFSVVLLTGTLWAAGQGQPGQASQQGAPRMMCQDRFDAMDTNRDGTVSHDEFMGVQHPSGRGEEVFKSRDTNADGALTKEEFCAGKGMGRGMGQGRRIQ